MITTLLAVTIAAAPMQQQLDSTFAVRGGGRLSVENMMGKVTIRSWDRDQMRVRADRGRNIEIDRSASTVRVEKEMRRGPPETTELEITVPRTFDVEIEGINLAVDVAEVAGDISIETVNGDVVIAGVNGAVTAETVQGGIDVRDTRGDLELESSNGGITIRSHEGDISVDGINGPVTLRDIRSGSVEIETVNGAVEYGGQIRDNGRYTFATHQGNLTLYVPENTNASFSIETWRGEVDAEFPIQVRSLGRQDRTTFTLGNGGARIEIESFGGRVILRRPR